MKTRNILFSALTLLLCIIGVQSLYAYQFYAGEKIYINALTGKNKDGGSLDWSKDNAKIVMYLWRSSNTGENEWVDLNNKEYEHNDNNIRIFSGVIANTRNYDRCKVIRRKYYSHTWNRDDWSDDKIWTETADIVLEDIYLWDYKEGADVRGWAHTFPESCKYYAPSIYRIPVFADLKTDIETNGGSYDEISVCPTSFTNEEPFSLRCPIKSDMSGYDYDIVTCHAWYKSTDGSTWTSVDERADRVFGSEGEQDYINNILPVDKSTIYYYLYSSNPAGRRLIKVTNDAEYCNPTCEITSLEVAVSAVNADNNTFTLDGMVAFEQADGRLIIECDGKSKPIDAPVSPQIFSISGISAASTSGVKKDVVAYFEGDESKCKKTIQVDVPNSTEPGDTVRVNVLAGTATTLSPDDAVSTNSYNWRVADENIDGASQSYTPSAKMEDNISIYDYREYNPISGSMADMMSNGDYLATDKNVYGTYGSTSYLSDYDFWDRYDNLSTDVNFYDNELINPRITKEDGKEHPTYESNGFAVVKSAHKFFKTYAKVTARSGLPIDYFGLFDAKTGVDGGNKRAWYAKTTDAHNPQSSLKLKKGTTYVFSFWAANINNYGEMMNAAQLQFKIKYTDTDEVEHTEDLGTVLDLGSEAFLNNRWHQCSATFKSEYDANEVEIMVMNLNTNEVAAGNDFALDDIQFHAISTVSKTVKSHQVFVVNTHEPAITEFEAEPVQMGCGESSYAVDLNIQYKNQCGKLIVKDITDSGDRLVWDTTLVALPGAGAGATWDELKTIDRRVVQTIGTTDPVAKTRTYKVYFENWTSATRSKDFKDPIIPVLTATNDNNPSAILPCGQLTYTLNVNVSYRNMSSDKIQVWVDGASYAASTLKQEKSIATKTKTINSLSFAIINIPADSAEHTLHVECAGLGDGCFTPITFRAPFSPKLVSVEASSGISAFACHATGEYKPSVTVTTTNHRNAKLTVHFDDGSEVTKVVKGDETTFVCPNNGPLDGAEHIVYAYFDYVHTALPTCTLAGSFVAPVVPSVSLNTYKYGTPATCDDPTTTLKFKVDYTKQTGTFKAWLDDHVAEKTFTASDYTAGSTTTLTTAELTLTGVPADGQTHTLHVSFSGTNSCSDESFSLENAPQSPTITATTVTGVDSRVACNAMNHSVTVNVTYTNGKGKQIVIESESGTILHTSDALATTSGTYSQSVTLSAIDGEDHYVRTYFKDYTACKNNDPAHKGTYRAPVKSSISNVAVSKVGDTKCDEMNYTITGTVTFTNPEPGKKLIVEYDGSHKDVITSPVSPQDFSIDMEATGSALTVNAYFESAPDACKLESNPFASPTAPSAVIKNVVQSTPGCDDLKYNLSFDVDYIYQHGDLTVHVDTYGDTVISIPAANRKKAEKLTAHVTYTAKIPADGNTHTLYISFAGENSCSRNQSLTAVLSPVITDLDVDVPTTPIDCDASSYPASVTVKTQYAVGKTFIIMYKDAADKDVELGTHKVLTSPEETLFTSLSFRDIGATGTRSVWAYFSDRDTCVKFKEYSIPPTTSIDPISITKITDKSTCDGVKYDLEGDITYSSVPAGAEPAVRFGAYNATMSAVTATSAHFKFTNVTTTGEGLHVEAYFSNKPNCYVPSATFKAPLKPDVQVINQVMADAKCNVMTTTLTFDIVYTKQPTGELKVWVNDKIGERTITYTPNDGKEKPDTIHAAVSGIPATGGAYTLHVNFASGCGDRTFTTPATKFSPVITDSTAVISGESCSSNAYTVTVTFKVKNGQGKTVKVEGKGLPPQSKTAVDGANTFTFTGVPRTLGVADDDYFEIYFPDALPSCPHVVLEYAETPKPVLSSITPDAAPALDCPDETYTLTGNVGYTYINAQPYIWLDEDEEHAVAIGTAPGSYTDKSVTPATTSFSLLGIPADGQTHTLHLKAAEWTAGCTQSQTFTAALQPVFGTAKAAASETYLHCGKTYSVTVTVPFVHSGGKKLYVEYTDGSTETKDVTTVAGDTEKQIKLEGLTTIDGASHSVKIWFEDFASCFTTATYKAPVLKAITAMSDVTSNDVTCGATSFSITGTVTANVAGETIVITTEGGESTTITSKKDEAVSYTITGLTDAGQLTAQFDGVACSITSKKSYDAVELKPYPTFSLKDITPQCYPASSYTIGYDHTDAATIKYTVNGGEEVSVAVNAAKEFTITTTGWAAGDYKVEAYAESAAGCKSATPYPTRTLTINKKPSLELAAIADVCEGTSGVSTAVTLKDGAAKYDYDVYKNDVLMSDQHKSGQTAASISLSTNTWEPATYKIQVTAYSSADCPSDPKEVSFVINPLPVISELTASQTICEEDDAVSYDFTITGAKTYSYSVVGTDIAETGITVPDGGSGTISFNPSALSDGSYTLQVIAKSELGCTTTRNAVLKINNKPTVALTATTNICYLDPAELDFNYTVSADAYYYEFHLWRADRSQYYGGNGAFFTQPVQQSGTIHRPFSPYGSPLYGGDYLAVMRIKNSAGCMSDSVEVPFTIYPIAGIEIYTVASMCVTKPLSTVFYNIHNANSFRYKIKGVTEWSDPQTPSTEDLKHFEFGISDLDPGNYTLQLQAYNDKCGYSNIAESPFTIYPLPTLTLDAAYTTSAGVNVCYPVAKVEIPYTSTNADTYTYELKVGNDTRTETKSASASGNIEVNTDGLPAGDYALSVTAVSGHDCKIAAAQTTTIHINPRPTFTFNTAVAHDCYPSTTISVGYTSTNADKYSYTLTKEGAGSPARTVADQSAAADGTIVLNTTGLAAGTYELEVTAKSDHNCEMTAPVTKTVTIYNQPTVAITSVENHCEGSDDITVGYTAEYATDYTYEVVGTTISGHGTVTEPGSFKINLSSLDDGDYTLRMHVTAAHSPLTCDGTTDEESFTVWAVPEVSFVTPAPIKEGVANVTVTLELDKAETYDWRFMNGTTTLESGADVPASTTTITLTTSALAEGTYTLFVTPKTSHCTGEEKEVHVVVNNKPTINFTDPDIVCAGTSTLNVEYSTSPDATDLYYTIMQGTATVVAEQHVDLTTATSPLAVNISGLPYGDYTLTGYVRSSLESGDNSPVDFTLLAVPTINTVTQDVTFIGCEETYEASIKVNIFNAAGRKIYAKYTDDGEHTAHVETSVGDETATITLTGLTHTDLSGKHQVHVYVDGFEGCGVTAEYDEPKLMTITEGFEVTPLPKSCGDENFTLTGKVVANCNVGKIVVEYDDTYKAEVDASTSGSDFTIADIPAGGSVTQLKAYFQGKTCGVVESAVFAEPTKPEASITYTPFVTPACDVPTFDLEFSLDYIYQEAGMLTVWVDDDHKNTYTNGTDSETDKYVALAESEKTLVGTIEGLPADGRTGQKLYFEFNGSHSCKGSVDLAQFPRTPLITGVEIVAGTIPDLVPGESGTYSPEFTVSYKWTAGETLVLEYQKANGNWEQTTTTVSGEGTYTFSGLTFDDVAMENREVHVHFDGAEFSECVHPLPYTTPSNSSAQFVSVEQVNTSTCDHLRYDLTGFVTFVGEPVGDLIVAFADSLCVIPNADCQGKSNTNIQFEIKNVEVDIPSTGMQLIAYFSEISDHKTTSDEVFNNPVIPHVEISDAAYSIPACNSTLTTLTFNLSYLKQQGDLHVAIDGVEQTYSLSETLALDNDETKQVTVTVADRLATGKTLPLRVWFDGSNSCDKTVDVELPFGAEISAIQEPVISDEFCDADDYTVTVQFTVTNGQGKNVTATCKGKPVTQASIEGVNTIVLTNVPRNTEANVVELFFADASNTTCAHQTVEFTQRPKPELTGLSIAVDPAAITCDAATYPLQGSISYVNLGTANLTMWLEENGESTAVPVTGTVTTEGETSTLVFTSGIDVPTDNRQYILHVKAEGDNWRTGCNELTAYISAVWRPAITSISAAPDKTYAHCDDSYTVSGRIDFVRGGGKYPVIACYEGTTLLSPTISYTAQTDTYVEYTISGLTNIGASDCSVKAYFEDYTPACADVAEPSAAFTAPTEIVITSFTATAQAMNCGATDYVVEGVVTANYATDAKIAITDGTNTIQVLASASGEPYTLSSVTLSGTQHLTATFVGHICPAANSDDFVEPALPSLDATMDIDTVFSCGGKEYKVDVTVISANQRGECAVLDSIAGGVAVAKMNDSGTFTIARPAASETHFIVVRYSATGCEVVIPTPLDINPYLKPKPLINLKPIDRLCDTETELVLPFAITQGDIDEATLSLTGSTIDNVALDINATKDTLTYTLAGKLSAGKHTVTVEARDTLGCITTAELPIEVALDGQIYSKWSDVLLIDNYNGLYTGYQWYRNDQPLGNEQILYVPEGMEGDNYYCLLTLDDGSQIYTCEYMFEDIPRSADNPREQATNNIVVLPNRVPIGGTVTVQQTADETLHLFLMSATGKRVAEYTQTQSKQLVDMPAVQGVYLLRIASGNEVHAAKIVVY